MAVQTRRDILRTVEARG